MSLPNPGGGGGRPPPPPAPVVGCNGGLIIPAPAPAPAPVGCIGAHELVGCTGGAAAAYEVGAEYAGLAAPWAWKTDEDGGTAPPRL